MGRQRRGMVIKKNSPEVPKQNWVRRLADHPVLQALGIMTLVVGLVGYGWHAWQPPSVTTTGSDKDFALAYPFHFKNESTLTMHDPVLHCHTGPMRIEGSDGSMETPGLDLDKPIGENIKPHDSANQGCGLTFQGRTSTFVIEIDLEYKTLFIPRHVKSTFTWVSSYNDPHWIEGKLPHDYYQQLHPPGTIAPPGLDKNGALL
jgi:hypothetical protein